MPTYEVVFNYRAKLIALAVEVEAPSAREAARMVREMSTGVKVVWTDTERLWPRHVNHVRRTDD